MPEDALDRAIRTHDLQPVDADKGDARTVWHDALQLALDKVLRGSRSGRSVSQPQASTSAPPDALHALVASVRPRSTRAPRLRGKYMIVAVPRHLWPSVHSTLTTRGFVFEALQPSDSERRIVVKTTRKAAIELADLFPTVAVADD